VMAVHTNAPAAVGDKQSRFRVVAYPRRWLVHGRSPAPSTPGVLRIGLCWVSLLTDSMTR